MPTGNERRRNPRIAAVLTASLSEGPSHYVVDTEDLSLTGLRLCPERLFPVGTPLHLVFGQPPDLPTISTKGVVRWFEEGKGVGVEFISLTEADREALAKFIHSHPARERR